MAGFMEFLGAMAEAAAKAITTKNANFTAEEIETLGKAESILRRHNFVEKADGIRLADLIIEANAVKPSFSATHKMSKYEVVEIIRDNFKKYGYLEYYSSIYECKYLNKLNDNIIVRFVEMNDSSIHVIAGISRSVISSDKLDRCVDVEICDGHIVASRYRGLNGTISLNIEKKIMPIIKEALNKID